MARSEKRDYLKEYLVYAPVALALLRAIECRELSAFRFQRPVLDLGCGDGLFGRVFFQDDADVGLDHSMRELHTAASRGAYRTLVRGDVGELPFAAHSFATVFSNGVLEHVEDLSQGLDEVTRVLRPGGRLIFTVPTMEDELQLTGAALLRRLGLDSLAQAYAGFYNRVFAQINLHGWEEWRDLLRESGLSLVHHRAYAPDAVFRLHDLALPASLPSLLIKRMTGRWVLWPGLRRAFTAPLWSRLLRRVYEDDRSIGCSLLMVAEPTRMT